MIDFFSKEEEKQIISAIESAEMQTSGEIRVHLTRRSPKDIMQHALQLFHKLDMHKTAQRNGVLILLAPQARQFAILGDEGINKAVPPNFWQTERDILLQHFRNKAYGEGVSKVIEQIGEKLKTFFPRQDDDVNELSDEISYDDD